MTKRKKQTEELFDQYCKLGDWSTTSKLITCPHCGKFIRIWCGMEMDIKPTPVYQGDCIDCIHLVKVEKGEGPSPSEETWWCGFQSNVNPIYFTKEDLQARRNAKSDACGDFYGVGCVYFHPKEQNKQTPEVTKP